MSDKINGYIVVRRPDKNFDFEKRVGFRDDPPCINALYYAGVDRLSWFEIEEVYFQENSPSNIQNIRKALKKENDDFTGIDICSSFELAQELLHLSNEINPINELIVIHSDLLDGIKGSFIHDKTSISWHGYDPVSLGHWSLLEAGLFTVTEYFPEWVEKLNEFGLFSNPNDAINYAKAYLNQSEDGKTEPVPPSPYGISPIRIGTLPETAVEANSW